MSEVVNHRRVPMEFIVLVIVIIAGLITVGVLVHKKDLRDRYNRYLEMLPVKDKPKTFEQWKADMNRTKTDHNRYPSSSDGAAL